MATIFYSLSGEGRGHSTRTKTVVDSLKEQHRVIIYTYGMAFNFLSEIYEDTENVEVRFIPGLNFHYNEKKQLVYYKTLWHGIKYLSGLPQLLKRLCADIEKEAPALVITDFEPALPRASQKMGVPTIAMNHQLCLSTYDLSSMPANLQFHAAYLGQCANLFSVGQIETIVSAFYFPPLLPHVRNVNQIGVMIRDEIANLQVEDRGYVVAYLRKFLYKPVLTALKRCKLPVHIYGLGQQPSEGNLQYFAINNDRFVDDLAGSRALIATGGNQVLGEVSYLRKPVLTIPEPGNYEQYINAYFLQKSGGGLYYEVNQIKPDTIADFVDEAPQYICQTPKEMIYGNTAALKIIGDRLTRILNPGAAHIRLAG